MPRKVQVELTLPERKSLRAVLSLAMLFLAVALALNVIATISLPQIPNLDIANISLPQGNDTTATNSTLLPDVTKIQVRQISFIIIEMHEILTSILSLNGSLVYGMLAVPHRSVSISCLPSTGRRAYEMLMATQRAASFQVRLSSLRHRKHDNDHILWQMRMAIFPSFTLSSNPRSWTVAKSSHAAFRPSPSVSFPSPPCHSTYVWHS